MTKREHRRRAESDLINTASWIHESTGEGFDACLQRAGELLAALSEEHHGPDDTR